MCSQRKSKKKTQILIDLNGEIDSSTIIGEFNTPFSITDRSLGQEINKKTADSNSTRDQMSLTEYTGLPTQERGWLENASLCADRKHRCQVSLNEFKRNGRLTSALFTRAEQNQKHITRRTQERSQTQNVK